MRCLRVRHAARWTLTALAALVAIAYVLNLAWSYRWTGRSAAIWLQTGCVYIFWGDMPRATTQSPGFSVVWGGDLYRRYWRWGFDRSTMKGYEGLWIPIWAPLVVVGLPAGALWRAEARRHSRQL